MKTMNSILYPLVFCLWAGFAATTQAQPQAEDGRGPMAGMMQGDKGQGEYRHGGHWMAGISDEQRSEMKRIKAEHIKKQAPLKARMKALKVELMAMALADAPDQAATDKKIDEMLDLKRQMLQNKVEKVSASRKALDEQQRAMYDIYVMKKAAKGDRHGHMSHGKGHGMGHGMGMGGMGHGMGMGGMGRGMGSEGMGHGMKR